MFVVCSTTSASKKIVTSRPQHLMEAVTDMFTNVSADTDLLQLYIDSLQDFVDFDPPVYKFLKEAPNINKVQLTGLELYQQPKSNICTETSNITQQERYLHLIKLIISNTVGHLNNCYDILSYCLLMGEVIPRLSLGMLFLSYLGEKLLNTGAVSGHVMGKNESDMCILIRSPNCEKNSFKSLFAILSPDGNSDESLYISKCQSMNDNMHHQ